MTFTSKHRAAGRRAQDLARGRISAAPGGQRSTAYRFGLVHIGMDGNIMFHTSRNTFIICMHIPGITLTSSRTLHMIATTPDRWKYARLPSAPASTSVRRVPNRPGSL